MAYESIVYVCDNAQKAETAKQFLLASGYTSAGIIMAEQVTSFIQPTLVC